ncbi:MAG: S41 family peptidase [Bacillota bacterium]
MRRLSALVLAFALLCAVLMHGPAQVLAEESGDLALIREVLDYAERYHIDRPPRQTLVEGAIWGIVESLEDPYASYLTREELESFMQEIEGRFGGVGIELEAAGDRVRVRNVLPGSPAAAAGLAPGDVITAVNGEEVTGLPPEMVALGIRGPEGTEVRLTVVREGRTFEVSLVRRSIVLPGVVSAAPEDGIARISVRTFGSHTPAELREALLKQKAAGLKGLVLDLRGNEGGLLDAAMEIAGYFLGEGRIVAWLEGRDGETPCRATSGVLVPDLPVVVLVDGNTASAAEILAGALRDWGRGILVGEPTFGKGSVQELLPLENGGALRVTTARYLTPCRRPVDGEGLVPDLKIETAVLAPLIAEVLLKDGMVGVDFEVYGKEAVVNGRRVPLATPPVVKKGAVYVPLRFVAEAFGWKVDWERERGAVLSRRGEKIVFPFDGKTVVVRGDNGPVAMVAVSALPRLQIDVRLDGTRIRLGGNAGCYTNFLNGTGEKGGGTAGDICER